MKYIIIHYNTPKLTLALLLSLNKVGINDNIIIFENSDKNILSAESYFDGVQTLHNENGNIINFNDEIENFIKDRNISNDKIKLEQNCANFGSFKHALTVQWLLDNLNEDFFLLDSDILIKKDFRNIVDYNKLFSGQINQYRVLPFLVWLNTNLIKKYNIKFCDKINIHPNVRTQYTDTGGSFLNECKNSKIGFFNVNIFDYIVHYGSGSWRNTKINKNSYQGDNKSIEYMAWLKEFKYLFI